MQKLYIPVVYVVDFMYNHLKALVLPCSWSKCPTAEIGPRDTLIAQKARKENVKRLIDSVKTLKARNP